MDLGKYVLTFELLRGFVRLRKNTEGMYFFSRGHGLISDGGIYGEYWIQHNPTIVV